MLNSNVQCQLFDINIMKFNAGDIIIAKKDINNVIDGTRYVSAGKKYEVFIDSFLQLVGIHIDGDMVATMILNQLNEDGFELVNNTKSRFEHAMSIVGE